MEVPKRSDLTIGLIQEASIRKRYPEFYSYLMDNYPVDIKFGEKIYWYYNDITSYPLCPVCNNRLKFANNTKGYQKYCSYKCLNNSKEKQSKVKQTLIDHYGVENPSQCEQIKENRKQTCLDRYGVENPSQNISIKEKKRQTFREHYGVDCNFQLGSKDIIDFIPNENGEYKRMCPHIECNKCQEKYYYISNQLYSVRKEYHTELCTRLLPPNTNTSSLEIDIQQLLDKHNINYICNDRNILSPQELDVYIPDYNIAIECNGVYWHSSLNHNYHINKFHRCEEKGIQLVSIWEDQLHSQKDIIHSLVLSKLGIYEQRIYARQCTIKKVDSKTSLLFLNKNHLQGNVNGSIKLGLYYKDELVSIMVFGKGRKCINSKDDWELYRYCNKLNTQVIGGASKLFNYFAKQYNPNSIISFSSNDISNGQLYKQLNFKRLTENISYWYIDKQLKRYHRFNFTKNQLIKEGYDQNKSESQIMQERGFLKIYDSGQTKWVWKDF